MCFIHRDKLLMYQEQVFHELYKMETLIKMTKKMCQEKEFNAQYYDYSKECAEKLSIERNDYINMLTIASDTLSFLIKLNLNIESVLCLDYKSTPTIEADR